jgi:hypothetical protein
MFLAVRNSPIITEMSSATHLNLWDIKNRMVTEMFCNIIKIKVSKEVPKYLCSKKNVNSFSFNVL